MRYWKCHEVPVEVVDTAPGELPPGHVRIRVTLVVPERQLRAAPRRRPTRKERPPQEDDGQINLLELCGPRRTR